MTHSDPRQAIVDTVKAATQWLQSYGNFEYIGDDDTDYIPAGYEVLGRCLAALCSDTPNEACQELLDAAANPPKTDDDQFFHDDLWTSEFTSPLHDAFDSEGYITKLTER